jgi:hypothetical protein
MQRHATPFRGAAAPAAAAAAASAAGGVADRAKSAAGQAAGPAAAVLATLALAAVLLGRGGGGRGAADAPDAAAPAERLLDVASARAALALVAAPATAADVAALTAQVGALAQGANAHAATVVDAVAGVAQALQLQQARLQALEGALGALTAGGGAGAAGGRGGAPAGGAPAGDAPAGDAPARLAYDVIRGAPPAGGGGGGDARAAPARACIVGTYDADFEAVTALLADVGGPGFAFVRYADGELGVAQGRDIGNEEWHFAPGHASAMQADLLASLRGHFGARYWYAFASPLDDAAGLRWYLERTEQACGYVSYANMWVNSHYPRTQALLKQLTEETYRGRTVLVVNAESVERVRAAGGLRAAGEGGGGGGGGGGAPQPWAVGALPLKDDLVTEWEKPQVRSAVKADAEALARAHSGSLFMVSGGPVGKVIIAWMWAANPSNKYVDFGSTLDPFLRGKHTRAYHNPNHQHAAQVDPSWYIAADGNPVSC